jgi:hypothetical protein
MKTRSITDYSRCYSRGRLTKSRVNSDRNGTQSNFQETRGNQWIHHAKGINWTRNGEVVSLYTFRIRSRLLNADYTHELICCCLRVFCNVCDCTKQTGKICNVCFAMSAIVRSRLVKFAMSAIVRSRLLKFAMSALQCLLLYGAVW